MSKKWSAPIIDHVEHIYRQVSALRFLHDQSASIIRNRRKIVSFPARIIQALVGSGSALSLITNWKVLMMNEKILMILTIIGSVFSTVESFSQFQIKELRHENWVGKLTELSSRISLNMALDENARPSPSSFLSEVSGRLANLKNGNSPSILSLAHKRLDVEIRNGRFLSPGRLDELHFNDSTTTATTTGCYEIKTTTGCTGTTDRPPDQNPSPRDQHRHHLAA